MVLTVAEYSNHSGFWTIQDVNPTTKFEIKTKGPKMVRSEVLLLVGEPDLTQCLSLGEWGSGAQNGPGLLNPRTTICIPCQGNKVCESYQGARVPGSWGTEHGASWGDLPWTQNAHQPSGPGWVDDIPESGGWTSASSLGRQARVYMALADLMSAQFFIGRI